MLWSIGKDSTIMLWLARKAFFGHCPIPLVHIDTTYKIPAMIEYRDFYAKEWGLNLVVGKNQKALDEGMNHEKGRIVCCEALKRRACNASWSKKVTLDSFSVSAATRKALAPKNAISRHGIKTLNGTLKTNLPSYGINIKLHFRRHAYPNSSHSSLDGIERMGIYFTREHPHHRSLFRNS